MWQPFDTAKDDGSPIWILAKAPSGKTLRFSRRVRIPALSFFHDGEIYEVRAWHPPQADMPALPEDPGNA